MGTVVSWMKSQEIAADKLLRRAQQPALELNPYRGSDDANASLLWNYMAQIFDFAVRGRSG